MDDPMIRSAEMPHMEQSEDLHLGFRGHFRDEPRRLRATAGAPAPAAHGPPMVPMWSRTAGSDTRTRAPRIRCQQCMKRLQIVVGKPVIGTFETPFLVSPMLSVTHWVEKLCNFGETSKPWKSHLGIGNDVEMGAETWVRTQEISKIG